MFGTMPGLIVEYVTAYGLCGLVVSLVFLLIGLDRVDTAARGAYGFRPLLLPGLVLLWPLVLVRWSIVEWRSRRP